jgi:cytochrome b561
MAVGRTGYSRLQIAVHWIIAALVIVQLLIGDNMTAAVDAGEEGTSVTATTQTLANIHYWAGISILVLALARFGLRFSLGVPVPAKDQPAALRFTAELSHGLFYGLLVIVPVLGLLAFYFGDPWGEIHQLAKPTFIVLIGVHVLAALMHQFILKDGTLRRMLTSGRS